MSRNYGLRPRERVYVPKSQTVPKIVFFFSMLFGTIIFAALLTAMMALAQFAYWLIP
jgi:hypothetical protein